MPAGRDDPALEIALQVARRWKWLGLLINGQRKRPDVRIEGLSVRFDNVGAFVVVRGLRYEDAAYVVAFGQGERLYEALRNVTLAIEKGQWKMDKYNKGLQ